MNRNMKIIKSSKSNKNCINDQEKMNTTTKRDEIKKSASTTTKKVKPRWREKRQNTYRQIKILNLSSKRLSRYQSNILLPYLKFTLIIKCNNIELKSNIQNYAHKLWLAEFFQNKEANNAVDNHFQKQSTFTAPRNRDRNLDYEIHVQNNLNLEKNGDKI